MTATTQDAGNRIPYEIVYCSSEDEPFPVTELLKEDDAPGHRGWQTAKNPKYPQSLVLRFYGDVDLRQIQILSHECKIASKVEVRVFSLRDNNIDVDATPQSVPSFRDVRFVKLGSVGFNSNEKSKYRSKERKTVHLKSSAYFLKLNFQKCHSNNFNTNQQVGVYSVVCCGYPLSQVQYHVDPPLLPPTNGNYGQQQYIDAEQQRRSESAMSEHGLPPIQGARAGAHPNNWQPQQKGGGPQAHGQQGGGGYTPSLHGGGNVSNVHPGAVYGYHNAPPGPGGDPASYEQQYYYTPTAPSLVTPQPSRMLPPIGNGGGGYNTKNVQFNTPNNKHSTAHPHDIPSIPETQASSSGYSYRSQSIVDFDVIYSSRTEELVRLKAKAVDEEDFDEAKDCKDGLKSLHHAAQHLYELERQKVRCIYSEDFDEAKHFKNEMDQYLGELYLTVPDGVERFLNGAAPAGGGSSSNHVSPEKRFSTNNSTAGPSNGARRRLSGGHERKGPIVDMPPIQQRQQGGGGRGGGGGVNSFEEEPVRSKYAIAMAQRREEHPSDDEGEGQGDDATGAPTESAEYDAGNANPGGDGHAANASYDDDASGQMDEDAQNISGLAIIDVFDINAFASWELDVFKAIHAEAADDTPAQPLAPNGSHVEAAECIRVLGNYMTACLLSKKWKLREAAIKTLTAGLPSPLYPNVPVPNVVAVILKFFEMKGYGLQDTIGNVFLTTCVFVQSVLQDRYECLNAVLPQALNLLPRFISRAGDANQKTRDEAAATVLAYALSNEVGANYVIGIILADPIDQDKRRIPMSNHRVQVARLHLWQQVLQGAKLTLTSSVVDASMSKLFLPCLNHSNSEVRDLAVSIVSSLLEGGAVSTSDLSKYISQVSNPTVKASLEAKTSTSSGSGGGSSSPAHRSSAGKQRNPSAGKRNNSAGKQRNNSAPRKAQNRSTAPQAHQQAAPSASASYDDDDY